VKKIINDINEYLNKELWMDFEIYSINGGFLEIVGFLDEMGEEKIKITFENPFAIICDLKFSYEGDGNFISIVDGKKAYEINMEYKVTKGNTIFKISNTDIGNDMYIVAKSIKYTVCG